MDSVENVSRNQNGKKEKLLIHKGKYMLKIKRQEDRRKLLWVNEDLKSERKMKVKIENRKVREKSRKSNLKSKRDKLDKDKGIWHKMEKKREKFGMEMKESEVSEGNKRAKKEKIG